MKLYRLLLLKAYFDKGFGLTNYFKYLIILFGWATDDIQNTMLLGCAWAVSCFIIGKLWYKYELVDTEQEIQNRVNPFCRDIRKKMGYSVERKV